MTKQCDKTEEKEVLPTYFERRENGIIYVRLEMPGALKKITPKHEHRVRLSMDTYDAEQALIRGTPLIHSIKAKWAALRKKHAKLLLDVSRPKARSWSAPNIVDVKGSTEPAVLTQDLIDELIASRIRTWVFTDDFERYQYGLDDDEFKEQEEFCAMSDAQMRSVIGRGRHAGDYANVVELVLEWCDNQDVVVSTEDPLFIQLVRQFAQTETQMHEFYSRRNRGDSPEPPVVKVRGGERLSVMDEHYREHKAGAVGEHHLGTVLNTWALFRDFKGDVFLDEVTSADIYEFVKFHMSAEGKKWSQSYATSKVPYYLREIFGLARTLKFMSVDNPAVNLEAMPVLSKGEQKSRQKPRFPLTTAHINKLLASDWYNPSSKKWRGKLGQDLGVRYFVPLIELLHGSRIREPLQLMVSEVAMIHGVWSFKFRMSFDGDEDEASTGFKKKNGGNADSAPAKVVSDLAPRSLKNESVLRDIPVHPKLLELGLLDYLELRRHQLDGKDGPLFPSSPPEPGGKSPKWGRAFEQALLRFMKDGLDFADGYVIHSFRHTFEDRLRDSQAKQTWPPGMNQFLSGRKLVRAEDKGTVPESGSEAEYGKGYSPAAALPYLERIDFSDIVFPRPFGEWLSAGLR